ncbi:chromosome segregation protein SMC [Shewanella amazonensis]|uniref:Chromosome partition protein Smc n=1 Tax=Shewanella amazonensis (strain ATCC BAA-1098 / SB2B) TaxID=326297 RepID=A1S5R5_SHEAM|nr:chromosome segregation protein SMC [Shewanella amazonensis]ABL99721.1 SMC family protein [Shewanella amazonensis SB2B]
MRLKQIKLAGFKSFVDPTRIPFPNPLTAIIGPNGCGKSNVIDAVRWVLGESSAKHLRGDSMTDVIFNGSSARRPVSVAGVELVFDNREGRLGGQYASYEEIAVKRQVSRDGESLYFLNGQKCRRKDITDLFMGTGLGPRSYAIIEQGMISRLIESRPQELRVFIEEAAGISRYKERRRDTENRIRHTRENLERLGDIRLELGKQLDKLAVQAEAAKRYREYKQAERTTHAELLVMRYQEICQQADALGREITQQDFLYQSAKTSLDTTAARLDEQKLVLAALVDEEQDTLEAYYLAGTEVARLEQQLSHLEERSHSLRSRGDSLAEEISGLMARQASLEAAQQEAADKLAGQEDALLGLEETQDAWSQSAEEAEEVLEQLKDAVTQAERRHGETKARCELTSQRLVHLKQVSQEKAQSLSGYREQQASQGDEDVDPVTPPSEQILVPLTVRFDNAKAAESQVKAALVECEQALAKCRGEQSEAQGRYSVLSRLLDDNAVNDAGSARTKLWQRLDVAAGWEKTAELLLGHLLEQPLFEDTAFGEDAFDGRGFRYQEKGDWGIMQAPANLAPWLDTVGFAESLNEAQERLVGTAQSTLIATKDGYLVGHGLVLQQQGTGTDKVALKAEAEALGARIGQIQAELAQYERAVAQQRDALNLARIHREAVEAELFEAKQQQARQQTLWEASVAHQAQRAKQRAFIDEQIQRLTQQHEQSLLELEVADEALVQQEEALEQAAEALAQVREQLIPARRMAEERRASVANIDKSVEAAKATRAELATSLALINQQMASGKEQLSKLLTQKATLDAELKAQSEHSGDADREALSMKLREQLATQQTRQTALAENRSRQAQVQEQIDALLLKQKQEVGKIDHLTHTLESLKLRREGLKGQGDTQLGQLAEANIRLNEVLPSVPPHASVEEWQQRLEKLRSKISRLGAINLAAIEEYDEAKARKDYLDEQDRDLEQALESLEEAIRKIDRETRSRFKATFEQVNADLGTLFPKVFGGGSAYLALTDNDLLETGVTIMARPPGKKNSTIHLLSGGEKALTALSLVFAIFRLNPAPFCMLDEVDAPLDDANVDRFCRLLQEMSASVQFIYISHNKITMEMADQLVGVTMHEPGVSRIVAVDIEEAVAMAHTE